jgi:hypothetical protein
MFWHSSGDTGSGRRFRRYSSEGNCCFLLLLGLRFRLRPYERLTKRNRGHFLPRLCRHTQRCRPIGLSAKGHSLCDQKPGMPKTRDFSVKGGNNFSSIHGLGILNHIGYQMLSGMENMAQW